MNPQVLVHIINKYPTSVMVINMDSTITHQEDYTVRIDAFQGPLDLLLYLIRRAEVDITDIPVALITEQYLEFLKDFDLIDIDAAGEFLVMAATLMEIKSRMLMPPITGEGNGDNENNTDANDPTAGLDQADPRYELIRQLLEYKKFRDAANELNERKLIWEQRFPLAPARIMKPATLSGDENTKQEDADHTDPDEQPTNFDENDLEDISVWDLAQVFQRIIAAIDFGRMGDHHVEYDDTPIELHEEDLLDQITRNTDKQISLRTAFQGRTRTEAIGLFLATLELVRQHKVRVKQDRINDDILLLLREEQPDQLLPKESS